jgi:hypothetical protein
MSPCGPQMVQSAFARHVLNRQLLALALLNPSESGRPEIDVFFNDGMTSGLSTHGCLDVDRVLVWANNGDAISRC